MRVVFLFVALISLVACQTQQQKTEAFNESMATAVGHNIDDVIMAEGPPTQKYEMSSGTMYVWHRDGAAVAYGWGNMAAARQLFCEKRFFADKDGIVQTWSWQGNCAN